MLKVFLSVVCFMASLPASATGLKSVEVSNAKYIETQNAIEIEMKYLGGCGETYFLANNNYDLIVPYKTFNYTVNIVGDESCVKPIQSKVTVPLNQITFRRHGQFHNMNSKLVDNHAVLRIHGSTSRSDVQLNKK